MALPDVDPVRGSTRRDPQILLWAAVVLLAARIGAGVWSGKHQPAESPDLVNWQPVATSQADAMKAGKPILYDFTAAWCPPCKRMKHEVFNDQSNADLINQRFCPVRVLDRSHEDGSNPAEIQELQRKYHIEAFPTLVIVAPDGRLLDTQQGYGGMAATRKFLETALDPSRDTPARPGKGPHRTPSVR